MKIALLIVSSVLIITSIRLFIVENHIHSPRSEQFQIVSKYPIWRTENDETDSSTTIFIKTSKYSNCEFKTYEKLIIPDTIYFCIKTKP